METPSACDSLRPTSDADSGCDEELEDGAATFALQAHHR